MKPGLRHILPWLVLAAACCVPAQRAGVERPVPEPAPVRVQLLFAGDVMQHLPQVTAGTGSITAGYSLTCAAGFMPPTWWS